MGPPGRPVCTKIQIYDIYLKSTLSRVQKVLLVPKAQQDYLVKKEIEALLVLQVYRVLLVLKVYQAHKVHKGLSEHLGQL